MVLLRSEDDPPDGGATLTLAQLWELARAWYGDRLDPDWRPRTRDESQAVLDRVGLRDEFWELPVPTAPA
jgi:hypothetical protein